MAPIWNGKVYLLPFLLKAIWYYEKICYSIYLPISRDPKLVRQTGNSGQKLSEKIAKISAISQDQGFLTNSY